MTAPLRSDAARNRDRILEAARAAFAEHGLEIGVDEIAQRAGVGVGTLYRRFPSKASLVHAIFEQRVDDLAPAIERALAEADPWDGFVGLVFAIAGQQASDQGFGQMVLRLGPDAVPGDVRRRLVGPLEELLTRAQASGRARRDVAAADLPGIVRLAVTAATEGDPRRHVGFLLDGLRAR